MNSQSCDTLKNNRCPLVTIITAVYNGVETIQRCIDSVSMQTYQNREYIIIDGGSTDGTVDVLKKNANKINFWLSEPDRGIYDAFNKALLHSSGDWIYFIGCDDILWNQNVLEHVVPYLRQAESDNVKLVYGNVAVVDKFGSLLFSMGELWDKAKINLNNYMAIPHQGLFHHYSWFQEYGYYDPSFRVSGDYELVLRGYPHEDAIYALDVTVSGMALGGVSSTHKGRMMMMKEFRRIRKKHQLKPMGKYYSMVFGNCLRASMIALLGEQSTYALLDAKRKIMGQPLYWTKL